ncbi:MAG: glycosyltransferase family 39 protein [Oscillospiraceae bacterium]|nr:glycosyltransferase family 39 protein [Oscillospiraceae bacterium]
MENGMETAAGARLARFCAAAVLVLTLLLSGWLFAASLVQTTDVSTGGGFGEVIRFDRDSLPLNLLVLAASTGLLWLFWRVCDRISLRVLCLILGLWTLLAGCAFISQVKLQPSQDSYIVTFWAMQAARGDLSYYHDYFAGFPYQFGYALYEETVFRLIFGLVPGIPEGFACMILQGLNLLFVIGTAWLLIACAGKLFSSPRVQKLTALLLLLSLHGIFFCTYLYGNIPGFFFAMLALWWYLRFQERKAWPDAVLCGASVTIAVVLKLNFLIVGIALGIVWLLELLRKWEWRSCACLLLCTLMLLGLKDAPQRFYERRTGEDFGSGVPMIGWLALGFHEGQTGPGWYEATYTMSAFLDAEKDSAAAADFAREALARRVAEFRETPGAAVDFFSRKYLSQWNEPTYEVIWNNNVREHFTEPGPLYTLMCQSGEGALKVWMNFHQQLVFFGVCLALVFLLRARGPKTCLLPLMLLGGMLYHLLFEAKSQYSYHFFLVMIPLAACGLDSLYRLRKGKHI